MKITITLSGEDSTSATLDVGTEVLATLRTLAEALNRGDKYAPTMSVDVVHETRPGSVREPAVEHGLVRLGNGVPRPTFLPPPQVADGALLREWSVPSGYRGQCRLASGEALGVGHTWHSGAGRLGETIHVLVAAVPGVVQGWVVFRTGRRIDGEEVVALTWNGHEFFEESGPREMLLA